MQAEERLVDMIEVVMFPPRKEDRTLRTTTIMSEDFVIFKFKLLNKVGGGGYVKDFKMWKFVILTSMPLSQFTQT